MRILAWNGNAKGEELERKGAELRGRNRKWEMMSVHGPLESPEPGREYFRIETTAETLLVYRRPEEKGMRRLYLLSVG